MEPRLSRFHPLLTVAEACYELRAGHPVFIVDSQQEPVAALCLAAQFATPERVQQIWEMSGGNVHAVLSGARLDALHILPEQTRDPFQAAETDHLEVERGMNGSPAAYSQAFRMLADPATRPDELESELPLSFLRPHPGGVLQRRGYAESVFDLLRCAAVEPSAVVGRVVTTGQTDGTQEMLLELAQRWQIGVLALDALLRYRREHQVSFVTETYLPTGLATFRLLHFQEIETRQPYLALVLGDGHASEQQPPLLRLHSACATGDIFGSQRCDCQAQLHSAMQAIANEGRGILLYMPQEGRGIGLAGKLQAYVLQEQGYDTLEANEHLGYPVDARDYSSALEVLRELGITHARLLTNNPDKLTALRQAGISVEGVPLQTPPTISNRRYLQTKQQRMGHLLTFQFDKAEDDEEEPEDNLNQYQL